jgi:S-phase kinase-associated protein 1
MSAIANLNTPQIVSIDENQRIMKLKSVEGELFSISIKACKHSGLLTKIVEGHSPADEIPFIAVKSHVLIKVIEFLVKYDEDQPYLKNNMDEIPIQWASEFIDVNQEILFDLILAANYMDIKPLLEISSTKVACMMKGKSTEEIRKLFNIVNDFTPEEETAIMAENKWTEGN